MAWLTTLWWAGSLTLLAAYSVWQLRNLFFWRGAQVQKKVEKAAPTPPAKLSAPTMPRPTGEAAHRAGLPAVAVLVPFRNEAANLPRLAASLLAQDYAGPTELIFIDDHSTDDGASLLPPDVRLLRLADHLNGQPTAAHKKAALAYAIRQTSAALLVTTDADCYWPADRLSELVRYFRLGAGVVLGPVLIDPADGFCRAFQALDLAAYQFLTAATTRSGRPVLANGANFAFRRSLFERARGYAGVDHLPSGDDVLLLHKFGDLTEPPQFAYATNAAVTTRPVDGWRALWRQRLRWAGKAGSYTAPGLQFAQALTFLLSLAILTSLAVTLALLFYPALHLRAVAPLLSFAPWLLLLLWGGKALVDLLCLWPVMRHFGQGRALRWYPLAAVLYPFLLTGVGTAALLGVTTVWKGRQG